MGYPMPGAMSVNEALVLLEADENDCIVGQDGSAVYNDGLWRGTLTTLEPGKGYLLKVNNDKSLRFNASRSSVRLHAPVQIFQRYTGIVGQKRLVHVRYKQQFPHDFTIPRTRRIHSRHG